MGEGTETDHRYFRIHIERGHDFQPSPRLEAALAELEAALEDEESEVSGFASDGRSYVSGNFMAFQPVCGCDGRTYSNGINVPVDHSALPPR